MTLASNLPELTSSPLKHLGRDRKRRKWHYNKIWSLSPKEPSARLGENSQPQDTRGIWNKTGGWRKGQRVFPSFKLKDLVLVAKTLQKIGSFSGPSPFIYLFRDRNSGSNRAGRGRGPRGASALRGDSSPKRTALDTGSSVVTASGDAKVFLFCFFPPVTSRISFIHVIRDTRCV